MFFLHHPHNSVPEHDKSTHLAKHGKKDFVGPQMSHMSKFYKIYLSKKTADIILIYQISYQLLYQIRGYAGFLFPGLRSS